MNETQVLWTMLVIMSMLCVASSVLGAIILRRYIAFTKAVDFDAEMMTTLVASMNKHVPRDYLELINSDVEFASIAHHEES